MRVPFSSISTYNFLARFNVIKKCTNKFDCLVNEMLCSQDLKPALNVQSDSLRAKVPGGGLPYKKGRDARRLA